MESNLAFDFPFCNENIFHTPYFQGMHSYCRHLVLNKAQIIDKQLIF